MKIPVPLIGLLFLLSSNGYIIGPSCMTPEFMSLVATGVEDATYCAEAAANELNRRPWNLAVPKDRAISDLANWIFGDAGQGPVIPPPPPRSLLDPRGPLDIVQSSLNGVVSLGQQKIMNPRTTGATEVEIHCDQSRFKSGKRKDRLFDRFTRVFTYRRPDPDNDPLSMCSPRTMAWTTNNGGPIPIVTGQSWDIGYPAQMQICPRFLSIVKNLPYLTSKGILGVASAALGKTAMDTYAVFDQTILHELTHTWAGGITIDIVADDQEPYGWKNCVNRPAGWPSHRNADSIAYFALGVRMIMTQNLIPQRDGSVVQGP